jgi:hypothetical protein
LTTLADVETARQRAKEASARVDEAVRRRDELLNRHEPIRAELRARQRQLARAREFAMYMVMASIAAPMVLFLVLVAATAFFD